MDWKRLLAYITGSVDQQLLTRNEYLAEEMPAFLATSGGGGGVAELDRGVSCGLSRFAKIGSGYFTGIIQ